MEIGDLELSRADIDVAPVPDSFMAVNGDAEPITGLGSDAFVVFGGRLLLNASLEDVDVVSVQMALAASDIPSEQSLVQVYIAKEADKIREEEAEASAPQFPSPWTSDEPAIDVSVSEAAPPGYLIALLPPFTLPHHAPVPSLTLSGALAHHFTLNPRTGPLTPVLALKQGKAEFT